MLFSYCYWSFLEATTAVELVQPCLMATKAHGLIAASRRARSMASLELLKEH